MTTNKPLTTTIFSRIRRSSSTRCGTGRGFVRRITPVVFVPLFLVVGCSGPPGGGKADDALPAPHPGEAIYHRYCFSCHAAGTAGAPKLGDAQAWQVRLANGKEHLLRTTIDGIAPGMPARGLCAACSDEELASVIDYMLVNSR